MMKKLIILFTFLAIAVGSSAFATQTRTMVMGWNDGIMVDDYNVFRFYGRTLNYPNIVVAEFSNDYYYNDFFRPQGDGFVGEEFYNLGIHWEFNEDNPWVLGTYVSTEAPLIPETFSGFDLSPSWSGNISNLQNRRIDLVYGRTISDMNFGFLFDYNRSSYKSDVEENDFEQAFNYYRVGLGLTEALSGQWDVALTFGFGSWTDKNTDGEDNSEPDGFYDLTAEGRYFMVQNPKITFVPHGKFQIGKRGAKWGLQEIEASETMTMFEAGWGMHYVTGPNLLAVIDAGVMYMNTKFETTTADTTTEDKSTTLTLPYI
ncbi:hypothetical protein GF377_10830, partial [candidate division GN15 bacterium]|nr:hypothetical protein [candidate division GN15 bacterium]